MNFNKSFLLLAILLIMACSDKKESSQSTKTELHKLDLVAMLDTIWRTEQEPIRLRDSVGRKDGFESETFKQLEKVAHQNHAINEKKIISMLEKRGWPSMDKIGEQGSLTICNVLQHSDIETRLKYIPLMKDAVNKQNLPPRLLARAQDRIATDQGELQIYGGQIKYYPTTKSFDVWPIIDPANVDKRRLEIGLDSIATFLNSRRTPMEWNLEDQIKRTKEFVEQQKTSNK